MTPMRFMHQGRETSATIWLVLEAVIIITVIHVYAYHGGA